MAPVCAAHVVLIVPTVGSGRGHGGGEGGRGCLAATLLLPEF